MNVATIQTCLQRASELSEISDSARFDVELLLCHVLDCDRSYLFTWPEKSLTAEQLQQFDVLLHQRLEGRPVAHLLGTREFWSLPLQVNDSTLIPRPDTEVLVEQVLALTLPADAKILDLGTGTGAIALALASEQPRWQITAGDFSRDAVALAQANARQLGLSNVRVLRSDWFAAVDGEQFDVVVSNPPYIDPADPHLQQGDVRFEPASALVADDEGFADLFYIASKALTFLNPRGWLLLEHGFEQAGRMREKLQQLGYDSVVTLRDYGGNDRVTLGRRP
ncbi:MAG: peptide chain release factor N(5)-glutamine methyltransferase [Candidatus Pelagadaptatus aseana]|uniref:peptide chain release factor N(5)-glutamine methyltransferase n=1 Tax=Candidatus Pelagadaptatus aseana TaxID=3120508 RepID=UPI0039B22265